MIRYNQQTIQRMNQNIQAMTQEQITHAPKPSAATSLEIHSKLRLIRHTNIIQLYEIVEMLKQLFLIMEYMDNGELFDDIVKCKKHIISYMEFQRTRLTPSRRLSEEYNIYTQTYHRASSQKTN